MAHDRKQDSSVKIASKIGLMLLSAEYVGWWIGIGPHWTALDWHVKALQGTFKELTAANSIYFHLHLIVQSQASV